MYGLPLIYQRMLHLCIFAEKLDSRGSKEPSEQIVNMVQDHYQKFHPEFLSSRLGREDE